MSEPNVPPPPSYTPPPPPPAGTTPPPGTASSNRGLMLVLSYLGILAVIPFAIEKNDPEVQWHAKHGIVLFIAEVILGFIIGILTHIPIFGCVAALLIPVYFLAWAIFHVILIVKAVNGQRVIIPGITQYVDRF